MKLSGEAFAALGADDYPDLEHLQAEIIQQGGSQDTALMRAARSGAASCVAILMMHAQQIGCPDYVYRFDAQGLSAFHWFVAMLLLCCVAPNQIKSLPNLILYPLKGRTAGTLRSHFINEIYKSTRADAENGCWYASREALE